MRLVSGLSVIAANSLMPPSAACSSCGMLTRIHRIVGHRCSGSKNGESCPGTYVFAEMAPCEICEGMGCYRCQGVGWTKSVEPTC